MTEESKNCPFCGEKILTVAIKCKFCSSSLDGSNVEVEKSKPDTDYGLFLLAIPIVTTMLIWFWVASMNLFQSPGSSLSLLMIITVIGTAIVAAMEASKVGMKSDRKKGTYSPTAWFFIITLLWIIGYPIYLFKRKHYGLKNHLVAGLLVMFVFIGSWSAMNAAIEGKKSDIRKSFGQVEELIKEVS